MYGFSRFACRAAIAIVFASAIPLSVGTSALAQDSATARDGQRDFDFEIGDWNTSVRVLRNPLSGKAPNWAEYRGTSIIKPLLDGRANTVELSVAGPAGRIEGVSLRLYDPQTRQWGLNYASLHDGAMTPPVLGRFESADRAVFYGNDKLGERPIRVRFVITKISRDEAHFEQAYSADNGATWEVNWIAVDKRR
ncbi:hypothetical protein IAG41_00635 [Sphingomonas sp. JC676]|uniref:hypothetical protein n=1 Tax=Sphingomonas sp. JC676 TaxID=2768065 RepID=UPI001657ECEE|nr:hypothetical protein [Sphingomonas sp. JC676]MBC9030887.1 hypothetical protein [Sphingomonas sp. JC676]